MSSDSLFDYSYLHIGIDNYPIVNYSIEETGEGIVISQINIRQTRFSYLLVGIMTPLLLIYWVFIFYIISTGSSQVPYDQSVAYLIFGIVMPAGFVVSLLAIQFFKLIDQLFGFNKYRVTLLPLLIISAIAELLEIISINIPLYLIVLSLSSTIAMEWILVLSRRKKSIKTLISSTQTMIQNEIDLPLPGWSEPEVEYFEIKGDLSLAFTVGGSFGGIGSSYIPVGNLYRSTDSTLLDLVLMIDPVPPKNTPIIIPVLHNLPKSELKLVAEQLVERIEIRYYSDQESDFKSPKLPWQEIVI